MQYLSTANCCPTAVDGGYKEVVELLVSKGAEVNRTHTASCWTCLHQAVYKVITELKSTHTTLRCILTSNVYIFFYSLRVTVKLCAYLSMCATWRH